MPEKRLRTAIVVVSVHHGNTLQIARAMCGVLDADLLEPADVTTNRLARYELCGFGSGIYFGRHHSALQRMLAPSIQLPAEAFLFSTAGLPCLSRLWHWSLRRRLAARGCHVVAEFSCRGWDTVGPLVLLGGINRRHPDCRDQQRAREFASGLEKEVSLHQ